MDLFLHFLSCFIDLYICFYASFDDCIDCNKECPFLHVKPDFKNKDCLWFDQDFCKDAGPLYKYRHVHGIMCINYLAGFCPEGPQSHFRGSFLHYPLLGALPPQPCSAASGPHSCSIWERHPYVVPSDPCLLAPIFPALGGASQLLSP
uniref:Cleavage and polyadenylation specificity factor subunit 4 n=1 Tax=Sus scrofa TaxID=9823 RepID=A0A4X1SKX4_PIG